MTDNNILPLNFNSSCNEIISTISELEQILDKKLEDITINHDLLLEENEQLREKNKQLMRENQEIKQRSAEMLQKLKSVRDKISNSVNTNNIHNTQKKAVNE